MRTPGDEPGRIWGLLGSDDASASTILDKLPEAEPPADGELLRLRLPWILV